MLIHSTPWGFPLGSSAMKAPASSATYRRGSASTPLPADIRWTQYGGLLTTTSMLSSGRAGISARQSPSTTALRGKPPSPPLSTVALPGHAVAVDQHPRPGRSARPGAAAGPAGASRRFRPAVGSAAMGNLVGPRSLTRAAAALRAGETADAAAAAGTCDRIDEVNPRVHAFVGEAGRRDRLGAEGRAVSERWAQPRAGRPGGPGGGGPGGGGGGGGGG